MITLKGILKKHSVLVKAEAEGDVLLYVITMHLSGVLNPPPDIEEGTVQKKFGTRRVGSALFALEDNTPEEGTEGEKERDLMELAYVDEGALVISVKRMGASAHVAQAKLTLVCDAVEAAEKCLSEIVNLMGKEAEFSFGDE
jgi:hypothetical protein